MEIIVALDCDELAKSDSIMYAYFSHDTLINFRFNRHPPYIHDARPIRYGIEKDVSE